MKCLVTGAAGFIGSHLCERLLSEGHTVVGLDCFIPYYPRDVKEANLAIARKHRNFSFFSQDLRCDPLDAVVAGADVVFHLAAMAGLLKSWTEFDLYASCNLNGTQRLLEAVQKAGHVKRFIFGSTSSVYGLFSSGDESLPTRPVSPYGVTKLAAENLCRAYETRGLPLIVLRYFSIYGPRQRPDMGYYGFIEAIRKGEPVVVTGDGHQARSNTYIDDCVSATVAAMSAHYVGETYNVGGKEAVSVWDVLGKLEKIIGKKAQVQMAPARPGDQRYTFADTTRLSRHFGWEARTTMDEGLARQVAWQQGNGAA
jgi:nucleoside-diphosphate-sugar epimerase